MNDERRSKDYIVAMIRNLCRTNYNVDPQRLDIRSRVDKKLTCRENWEKIRPRVERLSDKPIWVMRRYGR